jgi:hypothetical protein
MSLEQSPLWPLDITRQINEQATELDESLFLHVDDPNFELALKHALVELNSHSPLIGRNVYLYGTLLTSSIDVDDGEGEIVHYPLASPVSAKMEFSEEMTTNDMYAAAQGTYMGLETWKVYDPEFDRVEPRIVHAIKTGAVRYYEDPNTSIERTSFVYVLVGGADIYPTVPLNTHSYEDLQNDEIKLAIDEVVVAHKGLSKAVIVRAVGKQLHEMMPEMEVSDREMNVQRLSYLNSLDLLTGLTAVTKDFAVGTTNSLERQGTLHTSDLQGAFEFPPSIFDLRFGYERMKSGEAETGINLQLFLRHEFDADDVVYAPERNVMAYQVND